MKEIANIRRWRLSSFLQMASRDLKNLELYIAHAEQALKKGDEAGRAGIVKLAESIDPDVPNGLEEDYMEHLALYQRAFPAHLRYSMVFLLAMTVEANLNQFCRTMAYIGEHDLKMTDMAGQGMERVRLYFDKVLKLLRSDAIEWLPIVRIQKVRNALAHAEGRIKGIKDETFIRQLAKANEGLTIVDKDQIALDNTFCRKGVRDAREFFEKAVKTAMRQITEAE